jgi:hypothetical protein
MTGVKRIDLQQALWQDERGWGLNPFSPLVVKFVQKWQKNYFMADKSLQNLNSNIEFRNSKQYRMTKIQISKQKRVKLLTIS